MDGWIVFHEALFTKCTEIYTVLKDNFTTIFCHQVLTLNFITINQLHQVFSLRVCLVTGGDGCCVAAHYICVVHLVSRLLVCCWSKSTQPVITQLTSLLAVWLPADSLPSHVLPASPRRSTEGW